MYGGSLQTRNSDELLRGEELGRLDAAVALVLDDGARLAGRSPGRVSALARLQRPAWRVQAMDLPGCGILSTVRLYPSAAARRRDLGTPGVTALALAALLAGGYAAGAGPARHGLPDTGAAAAAAPPATPAAGHAAAPVASHGATSAVGSHLAPARPRQLVAAQRGKFDIVERDRAACRLHQPIDTTDHS